VRPFTGARAPIGSVWYGYSPGARGAYDRGIRVGDSVPVAPVHDLLKQDDDAMLAHVRVIADVNGMPSSSTATCRIWVFRIVRRPK